ncbi:hypothetical protein EMCG_09210 [[Emmonsia] crescens]|uniref:C2H2-type domain-containing protein n=1 Tax=[Emmonsia] crescens TaxID=73230 RepID=A0A0G2I2Q8_9EURO|nr:hypothetical protein EMCG_09210 [Emmonsia crescens UAMH 3008]
MGRHLRILKQVVDDNSERIHVCAICKRRFKRAEHCLRHERAHAKVKPYNCRFCARSYGRKDLVVRHEKTLHEADWNKAQIFIKKEASPSNGFSSSRRKSRLSSASRSDEWKSSVSPPPHFATQTAALLSSPEESGFNQNSYVLPQVDYSYSYPLIPGTQETADYPRESSIPGTSISSISQIPPYQTDQYYVEEQFLHQNNQHMPQQSAETYEESNVIPVDPKLFESPNTKTRLPSRSNASGCREVLSVWPDIYASRDFLECHRKNENGLERAKIYRDAQGQPIDGDLSLLRNI